MTIPSVDVLVQADKHKFSQVIRNVISNALKFSQRPGVVQVNVDVVTENECLDNKFLTVSDKTKTTGKKKLNCGSCCQYRHMST
jgi:signal transduction histidine kinase